MSLKYEPASEPLHIAHTPTPKPQVACATADKLLETSCIAKLLPEVHLPRDIYHQVY